VHILSTDSDELGDTTRHFILYGEFIFKYLGTTDFSTRDFLHSGTQFVKGCDISLKNNTGMINIR
jgi:hypothetical protein